MIRNTRSSGPWRHLAASVPGSSHVVRGIPCQDAHAVRVWCDPEPVLLVVCCDGAGSARHAATGSRLVCERMVELVMRDSGRSAGRPCRLLGADAGDRVRAWLGELREALSAAAAQLECELRDLACTLLLALVGRDRSVFAQIGDGAIVVGDDREFAPVFWPANGGYEGETDFVTDEAAAGLLSVCLRDSGPRSVAVLTDGLQRLALDFANRAAHAPFFAPLFELLDEHDPEALHEPFVSFLSSDALNRRSDDDRTLVIARREPRS